MKSLYQAYQAYERRVIRGEFSKPRRTPARQNTPREPLLAQLGDLLIHTGTRLKVRHTARKPMTWSPQIGSKP